MAAIEFPLSPTTVFRRLLLVIGLLVVVHLISQAVLFYAAPSWGRALLYRFDMEQEISVPTWFTHSMLLFAAAILGLIAYGAERDRSHWTALAIVFLYLSIDEGASLHELAVEPVRQALAIRNPFLVLAWIIPGSIAVIVFLAVYARFWWRLVPRVRTLLAIATTVYIGGAIVMESMSSAYAAAYGEQNFGRAVVCVLEEGMEMLGICIFIKGGLHQAGETMRRATLRFPP